MRAASGKVFAQQQMQTSIDRIKEIEAELHDLEDRRQGLLAEMREIRSQENSPELPLGKGTPNTNEEKVDLFLSLFGARRSVYPKLWINLKKGSKGYSPACSNEWDPGDCEKPRVKCSDCPNQNFPPLDHSAIFDLTQARHISNETCFTMTFRRAQAGKSA